MKRITLTRIARKAGYTIGRLTDGNNYICDTLEDTDRDLTQEMTNAQIAVRKVRGATAIPSGTYRLTLGVTSPRFSKSEYYRKVCGGRLPRLLDVPGFDGILIHCGNTAADTAGCIIVGYNKAVGKVLESRKAFEKLYALLRGEERIYITVK